MNPVRLTITLRKARQTSTACVPRLLTLYEARQYLSRYLLHAQTAPNPGYTTGEGYYSPRYIDSVQEGKSLCGCNTLPAPLVRKRQKMFPHHPIPYTRG